GWGGGGPCVRRGGGGGTGRGRTRGGRGAYPPTPARRSTASRHVSTPRSRNTGIMATAVSAAAASRAKMGRRRRRGKATLRAAKIEKARRARLSHRRGRTRAAYHGSTAVTSAPAITPTRKITLRESKVALAQ